MSDETRGDSKETPRLLQKNQPLVDDSFCCFFHTEHVTFLLLWTVDCGLCVIGTDNRICAGFLSGPMDRQRRCVIISVFINLQILFLFLLEC